MAGEPTAFVPIHYVFPWSEDLFRFAETEEDALPMIDRIGLQSFDVDESLPERTIIHIGIALLDELLLEIPGLSGVGIVFGAPERAADGSTSGLGAEFGLAIGLGDPFSFGIEGVDIVLRMQQNLLRPVGRDENGKWIPAARPFEIRLDGVGVSADTAGAVSLTFAGGVPGVEIDVFAIGDTGIIVEPDQPVRFFFSQTGPVPPGRPAGWRGVYIPHALVHLPHLDFPAAPSGLEFINCSIGSGGFSGELEALWDPKTTSGSFLGMTFGLSSIGLKLVQNIPVRSTIVGQLTLPFFERKIAVEVSIGFDGSFAAVLSAVQPEGVTYESGLVTLERDGLLQLKLESIAFEIKDGVFKTKVAGEIKPLVGVEQGLEWPGFRVDELSIDSKGKVHLEGGWLNLREKYHMNFHGFQLEITKLGFGNTEDGGKWIGFSGGVRLVAGMPAGASVEGLRITWYEDGRPIQVTLNGVHVDFEVPNTLKFSGAVSYNSAMQQFRGAIKLDLIALKMQVDATAVFGIRDGQNYLAVYLAAQFPAGIPLFATGLGVYGMAGLFAINMEPNRQPNQPWYEIGPGGGDWYHASPVGVTSLGKWTPRVGSMAFGAGITLGTLADNGHAFSAQMLLAIVFPGPILLLQGSANLLKERATLDTDATFRAIAVLDGRAGTLTFGLDAQYRFDNSGALIDIHGAAEGFFNFNDANAWRLNVGLKEPRERRLTARLFQLFEANAYVMLNAHELAMGAWIGFKQKWQFGPLSVAIEAWIDGNARVSWKPAHFYGDLWLHGSVRLAVFGFGIGLTLDARIAADVFDPFHVVGQLSVAIDLPWPFPDFSVNIKLEWGPEPTPPPLPLPLKEVAIEHFKATTTWPLPRRKFLLPDYDNGEGFFKEPTEEIEVDWSKVPVVPLDCRPHLTFSRNIHDDARVGMNLQQVIPEEERIGDPVTKQGPALIRYGLHSVVLEKLSGEDWTEVARKGGETNPGGATLYGSWAPVPQMPGGGGRNVGQVKLWLWSRTPFNYTRRSSRALEEWFSDEFIGYPCQTLPGSCWDFENIEPSSSLPSPWHHPDEEGLAISTTAGSIVALGHSSHGLNHAFGIAVSPGFTKPFSQNVQVMIELPRPTNLVRVMLSEAGGFPTFLGVHEIRGQTKGGQFHNGRIVLNRGAPYIEVPGINIISVSFFCRLTVLHVVQGVDGAIGGDYIASRHQLIFVEFSRLSLVELVTGQYRVAGIGYINPQDVAVTADGRFAYVTELGGTLLRVDLTAATQDRSAATIVSGGMTAPHQIALDQVNGKAYVVESEGDGRLLRIDLDGPTAGKQTVIVSGLDQAVGLLVTKDLTTAYISEQGGNGRLIRVTLATGEREVIADNLPSIFFLCWANAARNSILFVQRPPSSAFKRIDLTQSPAVPATLIEPFGPISSIVDLNDDSYAFCGEHVIFGIATTTHIPKICDVGGDVLVRHFEEELTRWSQTAEVLEPHTQYRLRIKTTIRIRGEGELAGYSPDPTTVEEFAYFQTAGPPGVAKLTPPIGSEGGPFTTPLNDLSRYVLQTMPRIVEPTPDAPAPARPFYRSYDIGIEFNENYVDLMYRLGRRDLTIHLYDGNGAIRDDNGGRLVLANQWGLAEEVTLTEEEERYLSVLRSSGCTLVDVGSVVTNTTFNASSEAHVLPPQALCEARLIPALLHDDFAGYGAGAGASGPSGTFGPWQVQDDAGSASSRWQILAEGTPADFVLVQTANATTTLVYANAPQNDPEQPSTWTDYRLTVHLRSASGRIGVVWRYQNLGRHYRFVMDRQAGKRELIRMAEGVPKVLAFDAFTYTPDRTYVVSVEAVKSSFRVYQDGALVFAVSDPDPEINTGTIGVHCAGNSTARFTDIFVDDFRSSAPFTDIFVDDFRSSAPVVYQFSFLTSRFKNFVDHLGSFENETWRVKLSSSMDVAPLIAAAVLSSAAPSEDESRAYEALFTQLPPAPPAPVVRVTRVEQSGSAIAFLIQSPEPFDWRRIDLQVLRAELQTTHYVSIGALVLRKLDGSGLMIVMPASNAAGSHLLLGEYRLNFTYRRDNRAHDSQSELLSEAGHTTPEQATLDIPWQTLV